MFEAWLVISIPPQHTGFLYCKVFDLAWDDYHVQASDKSVVLVGLPLPCTFPGSSMSSGSHPNHPPSFPAFLCSYLPSAAADMPFNDTLCGGVELTSHDAFP